MKSSQKKLTVAAMVMTMGVCVLGAVLCRPAVADLPPVIPPGGGILIPPAQPPVPVPSFTYQTQYGNGGLTATGNGSYVGASIANGVLVQVHYFPWYNVADVGGDLTLLKDALTVTITGANAGLGAGEYRYDGPALMGIDINLQFAGTAAYTPKKFVNGVAVVPAVGTPISVTAVVLP